MFQGYRCEANISNGGLLNITFLFPQRSRAIETWNKIDKSIQM